MSTPTSTSHPAESAGILRAAPSPADSPPGMRRGGSLLMGLLSLFLLFDGLARVVGFAPYAEGTVQAGYPVGVGVGIGIALVASTLLYLAPRTSVLGAVLLTGYLGGATATNLRLHASIVFPLAFGILVWAALYLRDARLRELLPLRRAGR